MSEGTRTPLANLENIISARGNGEKMSAVKKSQTHSTPINNSTCNLTINETTSTHDDGATIITSKGTVFGESVSPLESPTCRGSSGFYSSAKNCNFESKDHNQCHDASSSTSKQNFSFRELKASGDLPYGLNAEENVRFKNYALSSPALSEESNATDPKSSTDENRTEKQFAWTPEGENLTSVEGKRSVDSDVKATSTGERPQQQPKSDSKANGEQDDIFSPCDSDSFDWRNEISPIVKPKYKSKRRSSFIFVPPPSNLVGESPAASYPSPMTEELTPDLNTEERCSASEDTYCIPILLSKNTNDSFPLGEAAANLNASEYDTECDFRKEQPVLETICDDEDEDHLAMENQSSSIFENYKRLLEENKQLKDRLRVKTSSESYEDKIVPFRHVFETVPKLRAEIETLNTENAVLRQEKAQSDESVIKQIEELQAQMINAVTAAVEKASRLEKELQDSRRRNEELESTLAELQNISDTRWDSA